MFWTRDRMLKSKQKSSQFLLTVLKLQAPMGSAHAIPYLYFVKFLYPDTSKPARSEHDYSTNLLLWFQSIQSHGSIQQFVLCIYMMMWRRQYVCNENYQKLCMSQMTDFYNMVCPQGWSLPLGVNLATRVEVWPPGLKFGPQGWSLSPRGNVHAFIHPQVWTLSTF
jgi:hypothetical protein